MTYYVTSAKEITSNSSVTTASPEKFYGEMVCTGIMTVCIYSSEIKHNNSIDYNNHVVSNEKDFDKIYT